MTNPTIAPIQNQDTRWADILESLKGSMSEAMFNQHFLGSQAIFGNDGVIVSLPSTANLEMVESRLSSNVSRAVKLVCGDGVSIRFNIGQIEEKPEPPKREQVAVIDARKKPKFVIIEKDLFYDGHTEKMKPSAFAVYVCLAMHANNDTAQSYPSYATLAKLSGVSRSTAIRSIKHLESLGYIKVEKRLNDKGEFTSNLITILDYEGLV